MPEMRLRGFFRRRWAILLVVAAIAAAGLAITFSLGSGSSSDVCAGGSVLHLPAGTCINPTALLVTGTPQEVRDAVAEFEGRILYSVYDMRFVRLPVEDLDELDRIKAELEADGFQVEYVLVLQLS